MPLEPFTRRVLAEKYGHPVNIAFRNFAQSVERVTLAMAQMFQPSTCRLCGARPGHHSGCPFGTRRPLR